MKVLHVSTFDTGGAAKACLRLHEGLLKAGIDSHVLVLHKNTNNIKNVHSFFSLLKTNLVSRVKYSLVYKADKLKKERIFNNINEQFSFLQTIYDITQLNLVQEADIINLHWVANFLDYHSFFTKIKKPVVWTFHDINVLMGGFHYEIDKRGQSEKWQLLDKKLYEVKAHILNNFKNMAIVAPSQWMAKLCLQSSITKPYPVHHIPYGLDTQVYKPIDKTQARYILNLPFDKDIILFVADTISITRKGFSLLKETLILLNNKNIALCIMGKPGEIQFFDNLFNMGYINDDRLAAVIYSAADIFIIPSLEDNLPNTVLEATACGTPVIGFNVGGIPDIITDGLNGLLVTPGNVLELLEKITRLLKHNEERSSMGKEGRKMAEEKFAMQLQARRYIDIYNTLKTN